MLILSEINTETSRNKPVLFYLLTLYLDIMFFECMFMLHESEHSCGDADHAFGAEDSQ